VIYKIIPSYIVYYNTGEEEKREIPIFYVDSKSPTKAASKARTILGPLTSLTVEVIKTKLVE
jgi:hypothetical protein